MERLLFNLLVHFSHLNTFQTVQKMDFKLLKNRKNKCYETCILKGSVILTLHLRTAFVS
ncbi:Uncharacterised protein [Klebsiella oxytoca]|nr:Uncharacterised protein [Klebsiella oxytoca]